MMNEYSAVNGMGAAGSQYAVFGRLYDREALELRESGMKDLKHGMNLIYASSGSM